MGDTKALTHKQRRALINKPITICNYRTVHPVKRWGGVFVNDNFGEGLRKSVSQRLAGMTGGEEPTGLVEPVTQFDSSFHLADFALWERISGGSID